MSSDLKDLFDAFYERFLLRDLFGKVVPGMIVMLSPGIASTNIPVSKIFDNSLSTGAWIALIGMAWLAGFAIQSLGEFLSLIIYYPRKHCLYECVVPKKSNAHTGKEIEQKNNTSWTTALNEIRKSKYLTAEQKNRLAQVRFETDSEFYQFWIPVQSELSKRPEWQQVERFVVIKEACGNGYVALFASLIVFLVTKILSGCTIFPSTTILGLIALGIAALFLGRMHFVHVRRQQESAAQAIKSNLW